MSVARTQGDQIFPLVALDGTKVVAEVTLERQERGPLRLVGRIHWLLDPDYRGVGLGTVLVNHFIGVARARGLRHLTCMLISDLEARSTRSRNAAISISLLRASRK